MAEYKHAGERLDDVERRLNELDQRIHAHDWDLATFGKLLREIKADMKKNFTYEAKNESRDPDSIERAEERGQAKHTREYRG